jgi:hypothetical protein
MTNISIRSEYNIKTYSKQNKYFDMEYLHNFLNKTNG